MRTLLTLILIFSSLFWTKAWAQEQRSPSIQISNLSANEKPVRISDVKIDVKVVGSLAVTSVDMTFHNPNNRVLEGELQFPLAEGQSISRFALDINGKLREGVVVEKAKGQEVFESIIRRGVDPGLLEMTEGNNFKTRVYPLPAKGTRRIVIAYEQELSKGNTDKYQFFLPIEYRDVLSNFDLKIAVFADSESPSVDKTPWGNFQFDKSGEAYLASYSAKDYLAKGQLVFSIPIKDSKSVYVEKGKVSNQDVFYAQIFPEIKESKKKQAKKIALFWDASLSMKKSDRQIEMRLLDLYLQQNKNLQVELYTFNCILGNQQKFTISNGNWDKLRKVLEGVNYDGATQMGLLDFRQVKADEILLFSDGLSNFGKIQPELGNTPITTITSSLKANHSLLKYISITSGGTYVNLMNQSSQDALKLLSNESFRLISMAYDKSAIRDLVTSGTIVNPKVGFSLAGKLVKPETIIKLSFGIGNQVTYTHNIRINQNENEDYGNLIERVWAEKKIAELDLLYEDNKAEIEELGRKYNIVTRNTSLIVLDDIMDYVTNRITPPAELLDQYNRIVADQDSRVQKEKENNIARVLSMLERRKSWWDRDFKKEIEEANRRQAEAQKRDLERTSRVAHQSTIHNGRNVSGTILDNAGDTAIGCSVQIKGTNIGTLADMDGRYLINAKENDVLVFSLIGYNPVEVTVRGSTLDVVLSPDEMLLNETVVVGYGVERRSMATGSVQFTEPELIEESVVYEDRVAYDVAELREQRVIVDETEEVLDYQIVNSLVDQVNELRDPSETVIDRRVSGRSAEIKLNAWSPDAPYLKELKSKSNEELYVSYLEIRDEYIDTPSFFLEVSTLFEERGLKEEALIILSNLGELEVENYRLIRVLAHRLKQLGYNEYAIGQFKRLLTLRPEEPQTYRDLGLAYAENKDYQDAIDVLYKIVEKRWDGRFPEIEMFAVEEINNVIEKAGREKIKVDLSGVDHRLRFNMPVNIRIVLNWDTDNSDMDLWVTDPNGEKCYYGHKETLIGGMITYDFTGGYGPEEFLIKDAMKGKYKIQANYYGSREQTLVGPTTIYLDVYTYYSSGKEKKETITLRLSNNKEIIDIGEIVFE